MSNRRKLDTQQKRLHVRSPPPAWLLGDDGVTATAVRDAEWWTPGEDGRITCDLCWRRCELDEGENGWCRYRGNRDGAMELLAHGQVSSLVRQVRGYCPDPFLTYKPGAPSVMVGGTYCTSHCTFCMSAEIVWRPESIPWVEGIEGRRGTDGGHYAMREMLPPAGAVEIARRWGATQIEFGINEPTLSWEYTYDVARFAKAAGLDVVVETNGFTEHEPLAKLAPYVDAVDVGIKGSGDPDFYARYMKSPGAMATVKRSIIDWYEAGVHVIVGDVPAPLQH